MARSLKKGPYIFHKLEKRVIANAEAGSKEVIKTWSRASMITPDFVGQTITRTFRGHGADRKNKGKK